MKALMSLILSILVAAQPVLADPFATFPKNSEFDKALSEAGLGDEVFFQLNGQPYTAWYTGMTQPWGDSQVYLMMDVQPYNGPVDTSGVVVLRSGDPGYLNRTATGTGGTAATGHAGSGVTGQPGSSGGWSWSQPAGGALVAGGVSLAAGVLNYALIMPPSKRAALSEAENHYNISVVEAEQAVRRYQQAAGRSAEDFARAVMTSQKSLTQPMALPQIQAPENIQAQWPADFRAAAAPVVQELTNGRTALRPPAAYERDAQKLGWTAVSAAADAWTEGDKETSRALLGVAQVMADIFISVNPFTSVPRDTYQFFSGWDPVNQRQLEPWERALSGVNVLLTVAPFAKVGVNVALKTSMAIFKHLPIEKAIAGANAVFRVKQDLRLIREAGVSAVDYLKFRRSVTGPVMHETEDVLHAIQHWSPEAKASFRSVQDDLKWAESDLVKLSADSGVAQDVLVARRARAVGFYNNTEGLTGKSQEIVKEINGIDFSKEVEIVKVDKGTRLYQRVGMEKSGPGGYVTEVPETAYRSGVGEFTAPFEEVVVPKVLKQVEVTKDTDALKSTAGEMFDNWSIGRKSKVELPTFDQNGIPRPNDQYAGGGAIQLFIGSKFLREVR